MTLDPRFVSELERICTGGVFSEPADTLAYECDGLSYLRAAPSAVVLPASAAQVQAVVRLCHRAGVPFVARGHGTGLSGGAMPIAGGIVIGLGRLNRVLDVDIPNRRVTVEPGVTNLEITRRVAPHGFYFAPDPSSQLICSIGGHIAENSGGPHCLKYGFTVHHVLELDVILPDGELLHAGGATADTPGPDLLALLIGSEGTLGVVTKAVVRILRRPEEVQTLLAAFPSIEAAGGAVSDIIASGIVPAAAEIMDACTIRAVEEAFALGLPPADSILIVELDGPAVEVAALISDVDAMCRARGATALEAARDEAARARIWRARKAAFAAFGRISPNCYLQDGVVPRTRLPEVLHRIRDLEQRCGLRIGNVFHAGDGNLHPIICYDARVPGETARAGAAAKEILSYCLDAGGSITGEHGVGVDKVDAMPKMFAEADLELMRRVRAAFDPAQICNPGKALPTPRRCGEAAGPYRPHPAEAAGVIERY